MKLSIMLRTSSFRGDHSADVLLAQEMRQDETVEGLALRLLASDEDGVDVIEIRRIVGPHEEVPP